MDERYECEECGAMVSDLHQPIGELMELCSDCFTIHGMVGHRVAVRLFDATQVGTLDRFDADVIVIDGVTIRRIDVIGIELH